MSPPGNLQRDITTSNHQRVTTSYLLLEALDPVDDDTFGLENHHLKNLLLLHIPVNIGAGGKKTLLTHLGCF